MVRLPDPSQSDALMLYQHLAHCRLSVGLGSICSLGSSCPADTLYRVPDIPEIVRENIQQYMETELHIPPSQVTSSLPQNQPQPMVLCCCLPGSLQHTTACSPSHHW